MFGVCRCVKCLLHILLLQSFGDGRFYPVGFELGESLPQFLEIKMHLFSKVSFSYVDTQKNLFKTMVHEKGTQMCVAWVGEGAESSAAFPHLPTSLKAG